MQHHDTPAAVTRFFQTKTIPPALCKACDYVLHYNFVMAHVAGTMNTAADSLSRTDTNSTEKLEISLRRDIQTKFNANIQSSGKTEDEQTYLFLRTK